MPSGVLEESPTRKKVKKKNISQVFCFFSVPQIKKKKSYCSSSLLSTDIAN